MYLTQDYRKIKAVFDTPVEYTREPIKLSSDTYKEYFRVGPLSYDIQIKRLSRDSPDSYSVRFDFVGVIIPEGETLTQVLSKLLGKSLNDKDAAAIYHNMLSKPNGILDVKLGFQVFSSVIKILRKYFKDKYLKCLLFTSTPASRTDLYKSLIKRFLPGYMVDASEYAADHVIFKVCSVKEEMLL